MRYFPEVSDKGINFKVVKKNGEWMLRTVGWEKSLDENDPNYHFDKLYRESAYQKYTPLGMSAENFSKEYVIDKLLKMGYTKNALEKSFLQDARALIAEQTFVDQPTKAKWLNIVLDVIKTEEEHDGENKTDDSKDSKDFHKDLFDVEDELMDFIRNEGEGKQKEDKLEKPSKQVEKPKKEKIKKSGGKCPFDGRQGVYLRRYYQAPYWVREYKCSKGHIFQEVQ